MAMKIVLLQAVLIFSFEVRAVDVNFNTELEKDKLFIGEKRAKLISRYDELLKYFQVKLSKPIQVEVLPYQKNKDFKNCARIYGPYKIYAHSLESLQTMPMKERQNYNKFCFSKTYTDLYYSLIHEFVHSMTMINTNTGNIPKWVWEGIAVAHSGELKFTSMGTRSLLSLMGYPEISLCSSNIKSRDVYSVGGPVISYLEHKYPKITLKLVQHLKKDPLFLEAKRFFESFKIDCLLKSEIVINHLRSDLKIK